MERTKLYKIKEKLDSIVSATQNWITSSQGHVDDASKQLASIEQRYAQTGDDLAKKKARLNKIEKDFKDSVLKSLVFTAENARSAPQAEVDGLLRLEKNVDAELPVNLREEIFAQLEASAKSILAVVTAGAEKGELGKKASTTPFDVSSYGPATVGCGFALLIILAMARTPNFIAFIAMALGLIVWIFDWGKQSKTEISLIRILNYPTLENEVKDFFSRLKGSFEKLNLEIFKAEDEKKLMETSIFETAKTQLQHKQLGWIEEIEDDEILQQANLRMPNWQSANWKNRDKAVIRFGTYSIVSQSLMTIPKSKVKQDKRLASILEDYVETYAEQYSQKTIPAVLPIEGGWNLLIPSVDKMFLEAVQSICLQQLVTHTPGNVRFRFVDTLALGEWASPFLQISDTQPIIVGPKAWTTIRDIDAVIEEIRTEMENFVQKRLGNKFGSIIEHNAHVQSSGKGFEEPYRVVVFFGIPQDMPKTTCDSLLALMRAGDRCGVRFIMAADMDKLPRDLPAKLLYDLTTKILPGPLSIEPLANGTVNLKFGSGGGNIAGYSEYPYYWFNLKLDRLPNTEVVVRLLKDLDIEIKKLSKIKVNVANWFDQEKFQKWHSDEGLNLFLGETSDGKERYLEIGRDGTTNHHAFIVGQTGSGKGVLLRTMVMAGAWCYSADELEFYLLDLKEGVGFKPFVTNPIPHARVIALKGEREMGVSVLRQLASTMESRGQAFRKVDAENVAQYRQKTGLPMPRIVVVIDEFQKMFEDTHLATIASQLLEVFAREGRAFGIHLVLVTQDLGGIGSYVKQVQSQSGIRIALQCSPDVAAVVLSPNNVLPVRNLTGSGAAIYNDSAGDEKGNTPFQVAFLEPEILPELSQQISSADKSQPKRNSYVFNGDDVPTIEKNYRMYQLAQGAYFQERPKGREGIRLLAGASVELKPASETILQRVQGRNFLICGNSEEQALSTLTSSILGLASQHTPDLSPVGAEFVIVDFIGEASETPDWLNTLTASIPHPSQVLRGKDLKKALDGIFDSVGEETESSPLRHTTYFILYGLHSARSLRDDQHLPNEILALLKDGPEAGVHTFVWTNTFDSLISTLSREALKTFDVRAVLTSNDTEVQSLLPPSIALKLGTSKHLGILVDVEGKLIGSNSMKAEKYYPMSLPIQTWLEQFKQTLIRKTGKAS